MTPSVDTFIANIYKCGDKVPKEIASMIDDIATKAIREMSKNAGMFFHNTLNDDKHTEEHMKAVIELFPDSLSQVDEDGNLPLQTAALSDISNSSVSFVPLMAREGCRLGVGGEGKRGGLLSVMSSISHRTDANTILTLSINSKGDDKKITQVLESLRDMNLLKKADIQEDGLLSSINILHPKCHMGFEFFSNWDPDALGARDSRWTAPIHIALICDDAKKSFEMALKAGMKHFPERLGFLFQKEQKVTACKSAFHKLGIDTAMNIIRRCIPPSDNHLVLHHAFRREPTLVDAFAQFYPDAAYLRDANGHTLSQIKFYTLLRKGARTFKKHPLFFIDATDDQVSSVDPKTGLYPFMLSAVDNKGDLTAVYYLLHKNPKLVESGSHEMNAGRDSDELKISRKR